MKTTVETIRIDTQAEEGLVNHARKEADKGKYEAVGFLAKGKYKDFIHALAPMHNHAPNPQHAYFVEPWEQFRAEQKLKEKGLEIAGVYHSHVNSEALPSDMDHTLARPGEVVLIYSVVFNDLKAYREEDGHLYPIELEVVNGS